MSAFDGELTTCMLHVGQTLFASCEAYEEGAPTIQRLDTLIADQDPLLCSKHHNVHMRASDKHCIWRGNRT